MKRKQLTLDTLPQKRANSKYTTKYQRKVIFMQKQIMKYERKSPTLSGMNSQMNTLHLVELRHSLNLLRQIHQQCLLLNFTNNFTQTTQDKFKYIILKVLFKKEIEKIYLYCESTRKIIGSCKIEIIYQDPPTKAWGKFKKGILLNKTEFDNQYSRFETITILKIKDLELYNHEIDPFQKIKYFIPPKHWTYIKSNQLEGS